MQDSNRNTIRGELIELLLTRIEGKHTTKEVLEKANELCKGITINGVVGRIAKKLSELEKNYLSGEIIESEVKNEIIDMLQKLTSSAY